MANNWFDGFFLGLSTGMVCLAFCGPLLIPYLLGEGSGPVKNAVSVSLFLAGRLSAYLIIGLLVGLAGKVIIQPSVPENYLMAVAYLVLSILLIAYGFHRFGEVCLGKKSHKIIKLTAKKWTTFVPFAGGIVTGLNICPPFLLAVTSALGTRRIAESVWLFFMFFLGTTVYFIPVPFLGLLHRHQVLKVIGKFTAILTGLYYFYMGLKNFIFGFRP